MSGVVCRSGGRPSQALPDGGIAVQIVAHQAMQLSLAA